MEGPVLDANELDAIRDAIRDQGRAPARNAASRVEPEATPIALIADDRAAERVRPASLKLAARWATAAAARLSRQVGVKLTVELSAVAIVEGASLRETIEGAFTGCVEATGRPGLALLAAGGPMIEA